VWIVKLALRRPCTFAVMAVLIAVLGGFDRQVVRARRQLAQTRAALLRSEARRDYAKVTSGRASNLVPGDATITGAGGPQVAALLPPPPDSDRGARRIHLVNVEIGRDYGAKTEISGSLTGRETVVVNPGDAMGEGNLVKAALRDTGRGGNGRAGTGSRNQSQGRGPGQVTNQAPGRSDAAGRGRAGRETGAEKK